MSWKKLSMTCVVLVLVAVTELPGSRGRAAPVGTYTVGKTEDSGSGTLREAIEWANNNLGADTINFSIAGCPAGVCTIELSGPLPTLTSVTGTTIDGYSQAGASPATEYNRAALKIVIDGNGYNCFVLSGANSILKGLVIQNCGYGVRIQGSSATANVIAGNHIGTNAEATAAAGNFYGGVEISSGAHHNTIGGDTPDERNVISGNDSYGVRIETNETGYNTVSGNYIGTDGGGVLDLGNGYSGVHILNAHHNTIGGDAYGERNVISGNEHHGVYIRGSNSRHNIVSGNIIGAARDQVASVANSQDGVRIAEGAGYNTIGGQTSGQQNVILGNTWDGVRIDGADTNQNTVSGNLIGLHGGNLPGLGNLNGVRISGGAFDNLVGGDTAGERNVISANRECGVRIEGNSTTGNTVSGNYIGTDSIGTRAPDDLGNGQDGVLIIDGASGNTVGGSVVGERNVIADNAWSGVAIYGSKTAENTVSGNYVGLNAAGTLVQGNSLLGVFVGWGARGNVIGGGTAGERNIISGNVQDGVQVRGTGAEENVVSGNYIGLRPDGTTKMANANDGVRIIDGACRNRVGGATVGERNVISGNGWSGVSIYGTGTLTNTVSGNYIGTNANGTVAVGNGLYGVYLGHATKRNVVGGATAAERNVVSGNQQDGVRIEHSATDYNQVSGNYIGTNASGTARLGNAWDGVRITEGARTNTIGGAVAGEGNLISANTLYGVHIDGPGTLTNIVSGNWIGTSASGTGALGNTQGGITIAEGASYNQVGGTAPGERNVISGNFWGVSLSGTDTSYNKLFGNYVGPSATGAAAVPNTWVGVYVASGAHHNTVGGTAPGQRNVISGNAYHGVSIFGTHADSNTVAGNAIGVDPTGSAPMGNGYEGISIYGDCLNNVVGPDNVIAYNSRNGVAVSQSSASGNRITQNSIHTNGLAGIDLLSGANGNIAPPTINAMTHGSQVTLSGTACGGCTVELFENTAADGEGQVYLGSAVAAGGGAFTLVVDAVSRDYLTATATDVTKGTSEFSGVYNAPFLLIKMRLPFVVRAYRP